MLKQVTFALALAALCGCSTTTRYVTTSGWYQPTPAGQPAPSATSPAGNSSLFLTYWEGSCGGIHGFTSIFGGARCSKGEGKIVRCALQPDNSLVCKEEAAANKALSTD